MRFWITKNSEVSVREQLVRQVILAILSEDLPAGQKLPSIRALARRCKIHSNTVSAAYHHLLADGWLELRRGSGLYVRLRQRSATDTDRLDVVLTGMLQAARRRGYEPDEALGRLEELIHPRACVRVAVAEPDLAMREILVAEVGEHLRVPVEVLEFSDMPSVSIPAGCLIVSLPTRAAKIQKMLVPGTPFLVLRLRSVGGSIETQTRPAPNAIISIVSRSQEFRQWARAMLIAVGLEPDCLCEIDTGLSDWQQRTRAGTLAVTDVVAAQHLPAGCPSRVFRVIADASIAEISRICR